MREGAVARDRVALDTRRCPVSSVRAAARVIQCSAHGVGMSRSTKNASVR
jgi:hypothetical protein